MLVAVHTASRERTAESFSTDTDVAGVLPVLVSEHFRRSVLGCIDADFGVQIRFFQRFFQELHEDHLLASKVCKSLLFF